MTRLLLSTALACLVAPAMADTLTVLHTNDFHDRFEPINATGSTCTAEQAEAGECRGGIARLATAVAQARERAGGNVLLLDAGDQFQGSLLYTVNRGATAAAFMTRLGYDAMSLGNHEFDDGPQGLRPFLDAVEFPVLSANIDASREPILAGQIEKSVVLDAGGERVGIVGLTTADTPEIASPGESLNFVPYDAAQAEIDRLTAEGVNRIILLSHVGYAEDQRLARTLTGLDAIVGGHSHTRLGTMEGAEGPYPTMVGDVPVFQAGSYGEFLGEFTLTFDDAGVVTAVAGEPVALDASVAEDPEYVAALAPFVAPVAELRDRVVAEAAAPIDGARELCRAAECPMGNLVADAMLARVADQGVTIAIQNGGGLRASIDAGDVTMGEVIGVLPFQNTLSTFQVSGEVIVDALENGVGQVEEGGGRFPQVAGLRYAFDPAAPAGSRMSGVEVLLGGDAWAPIDPAATYGVVSNNYVRGGGDGYEMLVNAANAYDFGPDLADVVAGFLAANAPYLPYTDGRITVLNR